MQKAWIKNNKIYDLCNGNPSEYYTPEIAAHFDTDVDDTVERGAELVDGSWVNPTPPPPVPEPLKLSPVQFKLCFTSAERIAISAAKDNDTTIQDAYTILDDPRLTYVDLRAQSTIDLIDYLVTKNLITDERAVDIKNGKMI